MSLPDVNQNPFDCGLGGFGSYGYFLPLAPVGRGEIDKYLIMTAFNIASYIPFVGIATSIMRGGLGYMENQNITPDGKDYIDKKEIKEMIKSGPQASRAFAIGAIVRAVFEALGSGLSFYLSTSWLP